MNFRIGDKVMVRNPPPDREGWIEEMEDFLGRVGLVFTSETDRKDIEVQFDKDTCYWYKANQLSFFREGPPKTKPNIKELVMRGGNRL